MKEYYLDRLHWIFCYTKKKFWYCVAKTLCLVVGVPLYAVSFAIEMVLTFVNMLFSWIPFLNVVISVLCKAIMIAVGSTFYINILTDIPAYKAAHTDVLEYEEAVDLPPDISFEIDCAPDQTEDCTGQDESNQSQSDEDNLK